MMESDEELLLRLRSGDERAFIGLVGRYNEPMLRLAASFVPSRAIAEEVVQDTWLALLRGLGVGPEVIVGLCVERSPEMAIGLPSTPNNWPWEAPVEGL